MQIEWLNAERGAHSQLILEGLPKAGLLRRCDRISCDRRINCRNFLPDSILIIFKFADFINDIGVLPFHHDHHRWTEKHLGVHRDDTGNEKTKEKRSRSDDRTTTQKV